MSFVEQASRLLPGSDQRASANAYLGLTALVGLIGWGATAYVLHVASDPPSGTVGIREAGPWIETVTQFSWQLMGLWAVLTVGLLVVSYFRVQRGVLVTIPNLVWTAGIVLGLVLNAVSVQFTIPVLTWGPWLVVFTVGYLLTGLLAERGWIYAGAGVISGLLTVWGLFAYLTGAGALVISPDSPAPIAGAVLFPFPYAYAVLGALHVVPVAIDAALGGRGLTEEGITELKARRLEDEGDSGGGVVPD